MTSATAQTKSLRAVGDDETHAVEAGITSKPGDQGIATQEEDTAPAGVTLWDRAPSQEEFDLAGDLYRDLIDNARNYDPVKTVDHLLRVVDVHQAVRMPNTWPGDKDSEYHPSDYLAFIGRVLVRGCRQHLEVHAGRILFLWRNKEKWTRGGVTVRATARGLNPVERHISGEADVVLVANYPLFRYMNTRQKLQSIYHALRELDEKGKKIPAQIQVGFLDELTLFGLGTFKDDANLARAIEQAQERDLPWTEQPSLFDQEPEARDVVEAKAA